MWRFSVFHGAKYSGWFILPKKEYFLKINSSPLENDADDPASFWRGKRRIFNGKLPGLLYTTHFSEPFRLRPQSWYGYMGRCQSFGVFPWHVTAWTFCGLVCEEDQVDDNGTPAPYQVDKKWPDVRQSFRIEIPISCRILCCMAWNNNAEVYFTPSETIYKAI